MHAKTALITGGGSGLGYEFAKLFAQEGYNLVLVGRNKEKLSNAAQELKSKHDIEIVKIVKDLSIPSSPQEIHDELLNKEIIIDVLVNNAGFTVYGLFHDASFKQITEEINTNITSLTQMTHLFLPSMIKRGNGKILNLASVAAFQPGPLMAVYYASKSYVLSISEALSEELKGTGVTITALCPGPTDTGFAKNAGIENLPIFQNRLSDPATVARIGYHGLMNGKRVIVPGITNRIGTLLVPLIPRSLLLKSIKRVQELRQSR